MLIKKGYINTEEAEQIYRILKKHVPWNEGVKTRYGKTSRLQCSLDDCQLKIRLPLTNIISKILDRNVVLGIYLNYYRNGNDYCPKHKHTDTKQMIISLGSTRVMKINNVDYEINSGDVVLFDDEEHSIDRIKEDGESRECMEGRISIAVFYVDIST